MSRNPEDDSRASLRFERKLISSGVTCVSAYAVEIRLRLRACARVGHWLALPEDLRSELLTSYGRGGVANYHRNLLRAVEICRDRGVWRVPFDA